MSKITLVNVASLEAENTAIATMASNNAALTTAINNTLSLDGTLPNTMTGNLDMSGGGRVLNLPQPLTNLEPVRLIDLNTVVGGGTISSIPAGGATNAVLAKTSGTDYAANWTNTPTFTTVNGVTVTAGTGVITLANAKTLTVSNTLTFTGTDSSSVAFGSGGTVAYQGGTLAQFAATTSAQVAGVVSDETGSGSLVFATSPTLVTPVLGTPSSGTLTSCTGLPIGTGVSGLATNVATFLGTPSSANLLAALTTKTGTGSAVFATTPTLVTPVLGAATATSINGSTVSPGHYSGEPGTGAAVAGEIGEYIESIVAIGSAVSLVSTTGKTVTSISLGAGDWDVDGVVGFTLGTTTSVTGTFGGIALVTNVFDTTLGRGSGRTFTAVVPGAGFGFAENVPPLRFSLSTGPTTIFLIANCIFTVSTAAAFGIIRARRIR